MHFRLHIVTGYRRCKKREGFIMKKSDIAIYVSAILTLVLTTFVVFSTQKVTYENKVDQVLKNNNLATNQFAMATDPNTTSDANSPLFRNRMPDTASDDNKSASPSAEGTKAADIRDVNDNDSKSVVSPSATETKTKPSVSDSTIDLPKETKVAPRTRADSSFADKPSKSAKHAEFFDDEAPAATSRAAKPQPVKRTVDVPARNTPRSTTVTSVAAPSSKTHIVQYGEMLRTIAARHGTTTLKLVQANNLSNPDLIFPGQVIRLP